MKTRRELIEELKETKPNFNVEVTACPDFDYQWDGDSEDPKKSGLYPFVLEVKVIAVIEGEMKECSEYLGGCYARKASAFNSTRSKDAYELHGYFSQMLEDAMEGI
jgi:hypothetical protein